MYGFLRLAAQQYSALDWLRHLHGLHTHDTGTDEESGRFPLPLPLPLPVLPIAEP